MPGIIPNVLAGAKVVRLADGTPVSQPDVLNAFVPPADYDMDCELSYLPSDCSARIFPDQINAIQSELICFISRLLPDGSWDCNSLCNLSTNFSAWLESGGFSTSVGQALCRIANSTPSGEAVSIPFCDESGFGKALLSELLAFTIQTDETIKGDGTEATPFGVDIEQLISEEEGNMIVADSSGKLFVTVSGSVFGNTITGAGTSASPYEVNIPELIDPQPENNLEIGANGKLYAKQTSVQRVYGSRQDARVAVIPSAVTSLIVQGFYAPADGGRAHYKKVAAPTWLRENIITNGTFDTDSNWSKGTGWTITGGRAVKAISAGSSELGQDRTLSGGSLYAVTYTVSGYSGSGWVRPYFGYAGTVITGTLRYGNGTYTDVLQANPGNGRVVIQAQATVSCEIDNVIVREVMGGFQSADGAWWELDIRIGSNVLQFGAKGDGAWDDYPACQNAVDVMSTVGGLVRAPRGSYNLSNALSIYQNTVNWHDTKRVSFLGDGSGLTRFYYTGPVATLNIIGWSAGNALDTDGTYGNSWAKIGGFSIEGRNAASTGLMVYAKSWFEIDDIKILGCVEQNFHFISTVSWSGRSLRTYQSKVGMRFELGTGTLAYTIPNNITLIDCTVGNATQWGVHARNSGPINFVGGSFEGNGAQGVDQTGGAYFITNDAGIGVEAVAFNFYGTYFEHNKGGADVLMSQQSAFFPRVGNLHGCNFNRVNNAEYTRNNVRLEVLGASNGRINITGCGFNYGGDYVPTVDATDVPSAANRRCLAITGNISNAGNSINFDTATVFRSSVDGPSNLNAPWNAADAINFASLRVNANGTVIRKRNVVNVIKHAEAGKYRINFRYGALSAQPQLAGSIVGGHGTISVIGENASWLDVETKNAAGVSTDLAFSAIIFNA